MSIKNLKPRAGHYHQGYFVPRYPNKYRGDAGEIIFRSGWERKFMVMCDNHPNVIMWSSEAIIVPYFDPIKKKTRKYHIDFYMKVKQPDGSEREFLVEVKPKDQDPRNGPPVMEGKATIKKLKEYNRKKIIYITNSAKFAAAQEFARQVGMQFVVVDEDFLEQ